MPLPRSSPWGSLGGYYFFYFAFIGAFSPYWPLYLDTLGFDPLRIGVLMALIQVMRIFAPNLWGWLADRLGRHAPIIRVCSILSAASLALVLLGQEFFWIFGAMALMGFFSSATLPLVEATTLRLLGGSTAGYGRIRLWGSVGFIVAVVAVGAALDRWDIRFLVYLVLLLQIGTAAFSWRLPEGAPHRPESPSPPVRARDILMRSEVLALFAACFLMTMAHGPYYTFYSIHLAEHDYSKATIGGLWALGVICEIAVFLALPRLVGRFSLPAVLAFSLACAVLRFVAIGWGADSLAVLLAAQVLHAATFGSYHAAAVAMIHRLFPGPHQAKGQALYSSLSYGAGGFLGGVLSGSLWQSVGPAATFGLGSAAALAGLLALRWRYARLVERIAL